MDRDTPKFERIDYIRFLEDWRTDCTRATPSARLHALHTSHWPIWPQRDFFLTNGRRAALSFAWIEHATVIANTHWTSRRLVYQSSRRSNISVSIVLSNTWQNATISKFLLVVWFWFSRHWSGPEPSCSVSRNRNNVSLLPGQRFEGRRPENRCPGPG